MVFKEPDTGSPLLAPHSLARYIVFNFVAVIFATFLTLVSSVDLIITSVVAVAIATWLCGYTSRNVR